MQQLAEAHPDEGLPCKIRNNGKEFVWTLPPTSVLARRRPSGGVYAAQPFVGRFLLKNCALGTGKTTQLMEREKIPRATLAHGVASRVNIPVPHFSGTGNMREAEYGLILTYYAEGDFLPASEPAGTMGATDTFA